MTFFSRACFAGAVAIMAAGLPFAAAASSFTFAGPPASPLAMRVLDTAANTGVADGVRAIYDARRGAPIWLDAAGEPTARAEALVAALTAADTHALPTARYEPELLADALSATGATLDDRAATELKFSAAFAAYARDVSSGVLVPRRISGNLMIDPPRPDIRVALEAIAEADAPADALAALAPQDPGYAALRDQFARFRALIESGGWDTQVSSGDTLRPGDQGARVTQLRDRLAALGDYDPNVESQRVNADADVVLAANDRVTDAALEGDLAGPRTYDDALTQAVKRFQARHGLNQDGLVGPATRAELNTSAETRLRQIAVNLERMRWMNRPLGERHVYVNIADFRMNLVEHGQTIFTSRVVVGKAHRHETPEFSDEMEHMVVNPTWHVPRSIAREEILPKLQEDPTYLERKNMRLVGSDLPPSMIDWTMVTPDSFPGRVKQGPGRGNALGQVKFMFPNAHAIYLHDTPQKSLFSRDRRAFSHGCVRVQEAFGFAHALLAPQEDDPAAAFDRWLRNGSERYVQLDTHVPVHLTYRTAWVDAEGTDQFRGDIYDRDRPVANALINAGVALPES